jgi:hypothetical protein
MMKKGKLLLALPLILIALVFIIPAAAHSANLLVNDKDFKNVDEGWDFIPDYTGMAEGDEVNWAWTKPGVTLGQYKSVEVPEFGNISKETDISAQDLLTRNMKDGLSRRIGLKVVDRNADITVKGAIVDYFSGSTAARVWIGFGAGEPAVMVETYVVDNKTKEIISKIRHRAQDSTFDSAIAEVISDIINEWAKR